MIFQRNAEHARGVEARLGGRIMTAIDIVSFNCGPL
jgi:hypothetical protein